MVAVAFAAAAWLLLLVVLLALPPRDGVSLWKPRQATVHLVEPAAVACQLADRGAPHDPRGPAIPEVQN